MLLIQALMAKSGKTVSPKFLEVWGNNNSGQVGTTQVTQTYSWTAVSAGSYHTAAVRSDGLLFTWTNRKFKIHRKFF